MIINHNLPALNALRNLNGNDKLHSSAAEKLSSGLRINRAADDATGLAISQSMQSQIEGLDQATRNAQDATSLIQTADGALNESQSILTRMRDLAVQSANSTYTDNDRTSMQKEVDQLKDELNRIGNTTAFNNKILLDGSSAAVTSSNDANTKIFMRGAIQEKGVSSAGTYKIDVSLRAAGTAQVQQSNIMTNKNTGLTATGNTQLKDVANFYDAGGKFLVENPQNVSLVEGDGKGTTITINGDDTLNEVAVKYATAISKGLGQDTITGVSGNTQNMSIYNTTKGSGVRAVSGVFVLSSAKAGADGTIHAVGDSMLMQAFGFNQFGKVNDAVYAVSVTNAATGSGIATGVAVEGNNIIGLVHKNVDVQIGGSTAQQAQYISGLGRFSVASGTTQSTYVHLVDNTQVFQIGANELQNMSAAIGDMRSSSLGVDKVLVSDIDSAGKAITTIDAANTRISAQRSALGAYQNRLSHTMTNLGVTQENLTASQSQIKDVDMAQEMTEYSKLGILTQTANAMLAQSNQTPQQVLQLLR
ncbi:MAG TPA: flagellin [Firmicutes bacterium]|jgi:flagellin|nr:flagellin [Bacillota bacterium]